MCRCVYICIVLTLAYQGSARNIVSPDNTEISQSRENFSLLDTYPSSYTPPPRCPENMFPYQGLQEGSWQCRCRSTFLNFPPNNTCYEIYRQGPCQPGYYVYPPANEVAPRCRENPCLIDGLVPFNGTCSPLGSRAACSSGDLTFDVRTLKIQCSLGLTAVRASIVQAPPIHGSSPCPPGTRQVAAGGGCKIPL